MSYSAMRPVVIVAIVLIVLAGCEASPTAGPIARSFESCQAGGTGLHGARVRYATVVQRKGHALSDFSKPSVTITWSGGTGGQQTVAEAGLLDNGDGTITAYGYFFHANLRTVTHVNISVDVVGHNAVNRDEARSDLDFHAVCP